MSRTSSKNFLFQCDFEFELTFEKIRYETTFGCIEQLLSMSILTRPNELYLDSYALITVADYSQWIKRNLTQAMSLYLDLYQHGDPQVRKPR